MTDTIDPENPYAEVVKTLAIEFEWPCPADSLAMLVYAGLKACTEATIRHVDPDLAVATTSLRHVIDVVRHAPWEDFDDVRKALTVGFEMWRDGIPENPDEQVVTFDDEEDDDA